MNELNPFEKDLADRLRRQAQGVDIGETPMAAVVRRGRHRSDRRKVAFGVAAVATLSGTAIGAIQLLSKPATQGTRFLASTDSDPGDETPNGTVAVSVPGDELTPVTRVDSNLVWNVVEPGSTEALGSVIWDNTALAGQKAPYLAWSSAPGKSANEEFIPTLYRSDDGIHWQPAGGESFTQPDISMRGVGSRNGRMFAFGTAAATAPIPNGGGGEVVVDVSDDQGASWRDITLPIDLRGLAASEGVQSVGFQGDMVASDAGVLAVGVPVVNLDPSLFANGGGSYIAQRDGAISVTYPTCGRDVTATTISMGGYADGKTTATAITAPADTTPADATTTTNVGVIGTEPADVCTVDSAPTQSELIPWSDLGVDGTAIAATFTPRVFVSTDGETFVEGSFPELPDGFQMDRIDVSATDTGFVATAQLYAPFGGATSAKLYASADGMTWTESDMPSGQYNLINVLSNGTVVAFGNDMTDGRPFTAVSTDGVEWSKMTFASVLDPDDGATAELNIWLSAAGPGGITAIAGINVDAALEAGGFSIEKDGVRLTMTESRYQSMVATDVATGEELGRWDGRTPPDANATLGYDEQGSGFRVLNPDGTVRVHYTDADIQGLYLQQGDHAPKSVVLHSTDGINWSRDDVSPIVGFDSSGATRVQVTDSNVLISMVDPNSRDAEGTAKTVVLVGTTKS